MPFLRRFTSFPGFAEIAKIEGVVILDFQPAQADFGVTGGLAALTGEFLKGAYNELFAVSSMQALIERHGSYALAIATGEVQTGGTAEKRAIIPENGNGFLAVSNKVFSRLGVVRADLRVTVDGLAAGSKSRIKITIAGASGLTSVTVPGGTRFSDSATLSSATRVFAVDQDTTIALTAGAGDSTLAVNAFNVFGTGNVPTTTALFVNDVGWLSVGTATIGSGATNHDALQDLSSAAIDTRYTEALDATKGSGQLQNDTTVVWAARESDAIRTALKSNAETQSSGNRGRIAVIRPPFDAPKATAVGTSAPGVGATRSDRVVYAWPAVIVNVPVAGGEHNVGADGFVAALMNVLNPEENIGQVTDPPLLSAIVKFATLSSAPQGANLVMQDYVDLKAAGIVAPIFDTELQQWVVQSDVTSDLTKPSLKRRRAADFIQDSRRRQVAPFSKKLALPERIRMIRAGAEQFYGSLVSENNPALQRIAAYQVDEVSGNSPDLNSKGIFVFIEKVRLLASLDDIVLQTEIGESVVIQTIG